jgi:hypothetical protein
MTAAVTPTAPAPAAAPPSSTARANPAKPEQSAGSHTPAATVTISNAAKAALQEATETLAQTTKEARGNDLQAQRLLAKLAVSKS